MGDKAKIEYKGHLYTYKIDNIYNETKDGDVTIYRDTNRQTLTMITCTKNDDTKQKMEDIRKCAKEYIKKHN